MKQDVISVKASLDSLNKGMTALSKGVNFLMQAQGLMNGFQGLALPPHPSSLESTTLSGMSQKYYEPSFNYQI